MLLPPVNPQAALGLPADPDQSVVAEVLVLLAMLLALRVLTYVVLRKKTDVKQPKGMMGAEGKGPDKGKDKEKAAKGKSA